MIETLLLLILGAVIWCAGVAGWMLWQNRQAERVLIAQMKGMSGTFVDGFAALSHSMDVFEKRLKKLEDEVL